MTLPEWAQQALAHTESYGKEITGFIIYSVWELWLGKTTKLTANSTLELVMNGLVGLVFGKKKELVKMDEKTVALGQAGSLKFDIEGGKAVVSVGVAGALAEGSLAVEAKVSATVDAAHLVDLLFAAVEAKSPPGFVAIEETVKEIVKKAVMAL